MEIYNASRYWITNYEVIQSDNNELVDTFDRCSACSICNKCLAREMTILQGNKIYCWRCFENFFGYKCVSCLKSITGLNKMSFIFYNNQVWHKECFCCSICGKSLQGGQLIQYKESVYCRQCSDK